MKFTHRLFNRIRREWIQRNNYRRIGRLARSVKNTKKTGQSSPPVIFFNASTRLQGLSLNAAFSLLSSFGVQLAATPVVHWVCKGGLARCVLGTNNQDVHRLPPCSQCIKNSKSLFNAQNTVWFEYSASPELDEAIQDLSLSQLIEFCYQGCPLGELILPSLRWSLRCHHLLEDEDTAFLAKEYIRSAYSLLKNFQILLQKIKPQTLVVFNGMFYPEAVARWAAQQVNIPVVTHEVGMQPFSAFFTYGDATAYPLELPDDFSLSPAQNHQLDEYLSRHFQGDFMTAGVKFWPEMHKLGTEFWDKASQFKQFVPVFTNVVFDTSQAHANLIFSDMFAWLDEILAEIPNHPDTLFVIRAHPDELRPGKESKESVAQWVKSSGAVALRNVTFINADEMISSYELIEHAKFVMVYNSTVGLEAVIKGKPVLCAGKARYTQSETVFLPKTRDEFRRMLIQFLEAPEIPLPSIYIENARKILYAHLFLASLPFDGFIEAEGIWNGFVRIKDFPPDNLRPENSPTIKIIVDGILKQQNFLFKP